MLKPDFIYLYPRVLGMIDSVKKTLESQGIKKVVVASRGGKSAVKLAEVFGKGVQVISVSEFSYTDDVKKRMKKLKMVPVENADLIIQDDAEMRESMEEYGPAVKAAMEVAVIAREKKLVDEGFIAVSGKKTALKLDPYSLGEFLESEEPDVSKFIKSSLID